MTDSYARGVHKLEQKYPRLHDDEDYAQRVITVAMELSTNDKLPPLWALREAAAKLDKLTTI